MGPSMNHTQPTTRMEAIAEIERTRANFFSGMFAVVRAFPLDERETQMLDALLERLRHADPGWVEYLEREVRLQLVAWGKAAT